MSQHEPCAAFRIADFRYLLVSLFIISAAHKMQQVAVGWDIYERTGSAKALGWLGVATIMFGCSQWYWLSLFALLMTGAPDNISVVIRLALVPLHTPDELRGRVSAVNSVFIRSSDELGAFRAGGMAAFTGPLFAVVAGGFAILAIVAMQAKASPELRRLTSLTQAP